MGLIVNDEDFRCDWFISWEYESSLVVWLLLTVRDLLICAIHDKLKDLQVIFPLDFHAVNAVPEDYLSDERHGVCYASCDITLIVEHTSSPLPDTKNPRSIYASGKFLCAENYSDSLRSYMEIIYVCKNKHFHIIVSLLTHLIIHIMI